MARRAVGLALALDAFVGEVPDQIHPVALFGRVVARLDREWSAPGIVGTAIAGALPAAAAALAGGLVALANRRSRRLATVVAGLALFSTTSLRMLRALTTARRERHRTPSPNSGWPMATLAAVLDVELRKPGAYRLNRGAGLPSVAETRQGVRIVVLAGLGVFALAMAVAKGGARWS